jgi:hypothetical protein
MSIDKILPADKVYHFIESPQYNQSIFFLLSKTSQGRGNF